MYGDRNLLLSGDYPDISAIEKAFNEAVSFIHHEGQFLPGMLSGKAINKLIKKITSYLTSGISGIIENEDLSESLREGLKSSVGVFSGFKTFHEMNEAAGFLFDEKGDLKPFETFFKDVQKINEDYNKYYLQAEYDFAVASADMAELWEEQSVDSNGRYLLQYRTAGDDKVRPEHAALNRITLPADDAFWDSYYPPNGWRCRCTVHRVLAREYVRHDSDVALKAGEKAIKGKHATMFKFNPGKNKEAFPAYNTYTISKCAKCNGKRNDSDLCKACHIINKKK